MLADSCTARPRSFSSDEATVLDNSPQLVLYGGVFRTWNDMATLEKMKFFSTTPELATQVLRGCRNISIFNEKYKKS